MKNRNPWIEQHIEDEMAFTGEGYTRGKAKAVVAAEYSGENANTSHPCDCGGTRYYKATINAYQCPDCGMFQDEEGSVYKMEAL